MTALRLMLVRHGETPSNVRHLLDSAPPGPPLTELGRRQAEALAERLADEPVTAVYASTAIRAQETALPVAKSHGLDVQVVDGVHEVGIGELEGAADQESLQRFLAVYHRWTLGELAAAMPGGESGEQIRDRFLPVVAALRERHPGGLVVLVSHGGVIRLVAEWISDNVSTQLADSGLIPNTGHVLVEVRDGDRWHCTEWTGVTV